MRPASSASSACAAAPSCCTGCPSTKCTTARPIRKFSEASAGPVMIDAAALHAHGVKSVDEFKEWTRTRVRAVFPHQMLACGQGRIYAAGVAPEYAIGIDFPAEYLERMRNRVGGID